MPQMPSPAVALRTVGGIDAVIALQGVEEPVERRRRVVKNGRRALDPLDDLKLASFLARSSRPRRFASSPSPPTSRMARVTKSSINCSAR
jgi:hypothetical protein